jgi:tetratricopeptide (TPR) repeat protein
MASPRSRLAALALPCLLAAVPARADGFKCPEAGGPAWRELRTAHFVVTTDLSSGKAKELAGELERVHETIRFGLFTTPPETGVIRVLALRDEEEFDLFAPKDAGAFYGYASFGEPVIVLHGGDFDVQRIVIAHEVTHHVASRVFLRMPVWFNEGFAGMMESVAIVGTPSIGGVPAHLRRLAYPYHGGVGKVLRARSGLEDAREYAVAWALVHFLNNRRPQEFGQIQQRLARGQDPAAAWREVFPKWDPSSEEAMADLDREIGKHVASGEYRYREVRLPEAPTPTERTLGAAEAHDVRLSLRWRNRGEKLDPRLLDSEIAEALRHDPASFAALALEARRKPAEAVALAEKAAAGHPGDARAWMLLASVLPPAAGERRLGALRKAVEADPSSALALNNLAWELLGAGRAAEATPLAKKAVDLAPGMPEYKDTLAATAEARGHCAPALELQRRAVDLLSDRASPEEAAPYLERLARLEKACGGASAQPAPEAAAAPAGK